MKLLIIGILVFIIVICHIIKIIDEKGKISNWSESSPSKAKKNVGDMYKLYQKYYSKQMKQSGRKASSIKLEEFKTLIKGTKNEDSFYFSKYMCLLFLDTIYSKGTKELNKLHNMTVNKKTLKKRRIQRNKYFCYQRTLFSCWIS